MTPEFKLEQFLAGTLTPNEEEEFDRHLRECECCMSQVETLTLTLPIDIASSTNEVDEPLAPYLKRLAENPPSLDKLGMLIPQQLGKYELRRELGAGGFGVVYLARDTELDKPVALKILRARSVDYSAERLELLKEARRSCAVSHPNVVRNIAVGHDQGFHFIEMDYIEGENLRQLLQRETTQDPRTAAETVAKIASALHALHDEDVLHGDVTPGNIIIDRFDGSPRLADFGLAREIGLVADATDKTNMGTPPYMSPEQVRGDKVDNRTDIYGLGVVLFESLTGSRPFQGSIEQLKKSIPTESPPRMRRLNKDVPRDLETITRKCLEKNPDARYKTAGELEEDLTCWLENRPIHAEPVGLPKWTWLAVKRNRIQVSLFGMSLLVIAFLTLSLATLANRNEAIGKAYEVVNKQSVASRDLLSEFVTTITNHRLANTAGVQVIRKEFVELAVPYYEAFLEDHDDDPQLRLEVADAHFRLAYLFEMNGERQAAIAHYNTASTFFTSLTNRKDRLDNERLALAMFLVDRVQLTESLDVPIDARKSYETGIRLFKDLASSHKSQREYAVLHAQAKGNFGAWLTANADHDRALLVLNEAMDQYDRLGASDDPSDSVQHGLATCYLNMAINELARSPSNSTTRLAVRQNASEAIGIWTARLNESPGATHFQEGIGVAEFTLAILADHADDSSLADIHFRAAQDIFAELIVHSSTTEIVQRYLQATLHRARIAYAENRWQDAVGETDKLVIVLERQHEVVSPLPPHQLVELYSMRVNIFAHYASEATDDARSNQMRAAREIDNLIPLLSDESEQADMKLRKAVYLAWANDYRSAIPLATSLRTRFADNGKDSYDLACVFSRSAAAVNDDEGVAPADRETLSQSYAEAAIELLSLPPTVGFLKIDRSDLLANDTDLEWLRRHFADQIETIRSQIE